MSFAHPDGAARCTFSRAVGGIAAVGLSPHRARPGPGTVRTGGVTVVMDRCIDRDDVRICSWSA